MQLTDEQLTKILMTVIKNPDSFANINRVNFTGKQVKTLINLAMMQKFELYETLCNIGSNYKHIGENIPYILHVEMIPLFITIEEGKAIDYEHYPKEPNAYGV